MTNKKSHVIGEVDHTAGEVAAKLRGIAGSFEDSSTRPSDPGLEWVPYFLKLYGLALRLGVETPPSFGGGQRRSLSTLSGEHLLTPPVTTLSFERAFAITKVFERPSGSCSSTSPSFA